VQAERKPRKLGVSVFQTSGAISLAQQRWLAWSFADRDAKSRGWTD
jgi:hypothetical protein